MTYLSRWLMIVLLLGAGATAQAQDAATVLEPGADFYAALEKGDMPAALLLIEPPLKTCQADAGGDGATLTALQPCILLIAAYASVLSETGRSIEAVPVARRAVAIAETFTDTTEFLTVAYLYLGLMLERQGQHLEAGKSFVIALEGAEVSLAGSPDLAAYVARRSNNLVALARFGEALPLAARAIALAGDTADGNFFRLMHGKALMGLGRLSEAEASFRTGAARLTVLLGPGRSETVALREGLALCLEEQNRAAEAIAIWRETLAIRRAQQTGPMVADSLTGLGLGLMRTGELREAEAVLREALVIRLRYFGETSNFTALAYQNVGQALIEAGKIEDGAWMFNRALMAWKDSGAGNPEELVVILSNIASTLARVGEYQQAIPVLGQALAIAEARLGQGHVRAVLVRNNLAAALGRASRIAEAVPLLKANYDAAVRLGRQGAHLRATTSASLAQVSAASGDRAGARLWFGRADSDARAAFVIGHPQRINIGWSYGRFLLSEAGGLPRSRTLLREAGTQVLMRARAGTGFDAQAQSDMSGFTVVFRDQVRAAWGLSNAR